MKNIFKMFDVFSVTQDSAESDLDDEAMFRIDSHIAAVFRSKKLGSNVDKERKQKQLLHYKMRRVSFVLLLIFEINR